MSYYNTIPNDALVLNDIHESNISIQKPPLFNIIFKDDDVTTMQFVIDLLHDHFNKSDEESYKMMMEVHINGYCIAGTYTKDVAETKLKSVQSIISQSDYPFKIFMDIQS